MSYGQSLGTGRGLLSRYERFFPIGPKTPRISLGEGETPLIRSRSLEELTNAKQVWLKCDGANPTGSFKDRGMVLATAKAVEDGAAAVVCASTGNTSASAAAYAARAGLKCAVLVSDEISAAKMAQVQMYGAEVILMDANFDSRLSMAKEITTAVPGVTHVNSVNPYRLIGQRSAAFEICDQLGCAPDEVFIPVGNAGNIHAYWNGFSEYMSAGIVDSRPCMRGFQAEGAAPIVRGKVISAPVTIASALRIGNPENWEKAIEARDESGGTIQAVSDKSIMDAYQALGKEGVFCEPASAASVAGLLLRAKQGLVDPEACVVCVLTGHGLKDSEVADANSLKPTILAPQASDVIDKMNW